MNYLSAFKDIHTFIFDVDGVLTNSELLITEKGELLRKMHTQDGYAIHKAIKEGFEIIIITGGSSQGVVKRLEGLGIKNIYSGVKNKLEIYQNILLEKNYKHTDEQGILYMGDDIPDYKVMTQVGLACAPKDAVPEIIQVANYISDKNGGKGCVRDVIEKVLKLNGKWPITKTITPRSAK